MFRQLAYTATPIVELKSASIARAALNVFVKREDLNHPFISGNKWWKLTYNLAHAQQQNYDTLLTFGGAFSNHIFATAAAGRELGLKTIGIIRGDEVFPLNHTLAFAQHCGMTLHYISRDAYRKKTEQNFIDQLRNQFGGFYLIPEGGTNDLAVKGCVEFAAQLNSEIVFDHLCLSVGTGGTMAGMIEGLAASKNVIGFSSLKGGEFLVNELRQLISAEKTNWSINTDYHFGGYGKTTQELNNFIRDAEENWQLPLDKVYTSKMVFGVLDLIAKGYFKKGSTLLLLHTGGLQGNGHDKNL